MLYRICNYTWTLPFDTSWPHTKIYRPLNKRDERLGEVGNEIRKATCMTCSKIGYIIGVVLSMFLCVKKNHPKVLK